MGLLSSVLSIGGGLIGTAIGGPAGGKIGAAIGGAAGGALSSSKGSSKATKAQLESIAEGRRIAGEAKSEAIGYQQPYMGLGAGSANALSSRLGIPVAPNGATAPPAAANALTMGPAPGGPQGPPLASRGSGVPSPDAAGLDLSALGNSGPNIFIRDPQGLQYASDDFGGRQAAPNAPPQSQPSPDVPMNALSGGPTGGAATGVDPGTFGSTANPVAPTPYTAPAPPPTYQPGPAYSAPTAPEAYRAPSDFQYGANEYKASPGFQYRLDKAVNTVQGSAAAQGSLFSGATLKELSDRASNEAYADFSRERDFALGRYTDQRDFNYGLSRDARADFQNDRGFGRDVYSDDRDFGYGVSRDARRDYEDTRGFDYGLSRDARQDYQDDRGYLTDRFDTQTNNLFRGVAVGQGAAGVASGAATRYGDQAVGLATDAGNARAANALTQGQIGADLATGLGGVIAGAIPGVPRNALTMQSPPGYVNFVNTPASIRF